MLDNKISLHPLDMGWKRNIINLQICIRWSQDSQHHTCMPIPLAPDPIRVQSCVCCLFWTNGVNIYLSIYQIRDMNPLIGANSKWKYLQFYWNYSEHKNYDFRMCKNYDFRMCTSLHLAINLLLTFYTTFCTTFMH